MNDQKKYYNKVEEINALGFDWAVDSCVDAENVFPLTEADSNFWQQMYICLKDSVEMRLTEAGINIKDYNF